MFKPSLYLLQQTNNINKENINPNTNKEKPVINQNNKVIKSTQNKIKQRKSNKSNNSEYSFTPTLNKKSLRIAQNLENSFVRLTKNKNKKMFCDDITLNNLSFNNSLVNKKIKSNVRINWLFHYVLLKEK